MTQDLELTDLRFTVFSALVDGERVGSEGATLESVFRDVTGLSPATVQRGNFQAGPLNWASCSSLGNEIGLAVQAGRVDINVNPSAPQTQAKPPVLKGKSPELVSGIVEKGAKLFAIVPEVNRIALAVGGAFFFENEGSAVAEFCVRTGIRLSGDGFREPSFKFNKRISVDDNDLELNNIRSFEVGSVQMFAISSGGMMLKEVNFLRIFGDFNSVPLDKAVDGDAFQSAIEIIKSNANEMIKNPRLEGIIE